MRASIKLYQFQFNQKAFDKAVRLVIETIMREAASIGAMSASSRVPVWSGMARGGFLGRVTAFDGRRRTAQSYLGLSDSPSSIDISGKVVARKSKLKRNWKGQFGVTKKDKNAGAARAEYEFRRTSTTLSVRFKHNIWQLKEGDPGPSQWIKSAPWHAMEVGQRAFADYMNLPYNQKRIQDVKLENYVIAKAITGGA